MFSAALRQQRTAGLLCKSLTVIVVVTMTPLAARSTLWRSAGTQAARRQMSTAPKMHKATDKWAGFVKERPPKDHLDEHVSLNGRQSDSVRCSPSVFSRDYPLFVSVFQLVFHPPYNGVAVGLGIFTVFVSRRQKL